MTFDFENNFSGTSSITNYQYRDGYLYKKLFYFSQTNEYILAGLTYTLCYIYLVHLDSNFSIKYSGEVNIFSSFCDSPNTFSIMFYEGKYSIVIDNKSYSGNKILIEKVNQVTIGNIETIDYFKKIPMNKNPFYTWLTPVLTGVVTIACFFLFQPEEPTALFWINLVYTLLLEALFFGWLLWGGRRES